MTGIRRWAGGLALVTAGLASSAEAINIVPVFNSTDNDTPGFDLFNNGIQDLFGYAETYYQDIFEDAGYTLTINFWYEDLNDSILGVFNPVTTVGNRVTEANIRIDTQLDLGGAFRPWYIDSNPATDGEFEMEKTVWSSGGFSMADYTFPLDIPLAFEVGYRGLADEGSQAEGKFDMLSTVLHEVGHALGIRSGATHENSDNDYDFDPDFLFGKEAAARIDTKDGQPDPGHMRGSTLLMCGECGAANVRRRPSHADFFAMATSNELTQIDVPRREFYGGGVFNFGPNWSGGRTPDNNDDAYMRDGGLVTLNASDIIANLYIISDTQLATGSNTLTSNGIISIESQFFQEFAKLIVATGGQVNADNIVIARRGELNMAGGTVDVGNDLFVDDGVCCNTPDGAVSGNGTVNIVGELINEGEIRPEGGILTINAATMDLDGSDGPTVNSLINATAGNVVFNGVQTDPYDFPIQIGFARQVTFNSPWTLGAMGNVTITDGGLINNGAWQADGALVIDHTVPFGIVGIGGTGSMTLGTTGQITTSGIADFLGPSTIEGSIHVTTEAARFSAGGTFASSAVVTLDAGTTMNLIFDNTYTIEGGATFNGPGTLVIAELATVILNDNLVLGAPLLNKGRMEVGSSPGLVITQADFEQEVTGVAEFEIGGNIQGGNYDFLDVTGHTATLAGTLELSLINGFVPGHGDLFTIIAADSIVGTFDTVIGADTGTVTLDVQYTATTVVLEAIINLLLGDANNDGQVTGADLIAVQQNFGDIGPADGLLPGDANDDGQVTGADLIVVQQNFGNVLAPVLGNVPEPGTMGLIGVLVCAGSLRRKREGRGT